MFIYQGYILGTCPPDRCSYRFGNLSFGNSTLEPYTATHNLVFHAGASEIYQKYYQVSRATNLILFYELGGYYLNHYRHVVFERVRIKEQERTEMNQLLF